MSDGLVTTCTYCGTELVGHERTRKPPACNAHRWLVKRDPVYTSSRRLTERELHAAVANDEREV